MNKKLIVGIILGVVVCLLVGGYTGYKLSKSKALGSTSYDEANLSSLNVDNNANVRGDLTVDGTATFSGVATNTPNPSITTLAVSGASALHAVTATTIAGTTFAPTGISTMATTSVTAICVKESGGNWVKVTFSGVTPSYATSTTCL